MTSSALRNVANISLNSHVFPRASVFCTVVIISVKSMTMGCCHVMKAFLCVPRSCVNLPNARYDNVVNGIVCGKAEMELKSPAT